MFMDWDRVKVYKHAKKELGQYPAILTEKASLVNNPYVLPKDTTQCPQPGLEPRLLALESGTLTLRPLYLHNTMDTVLSGEYKI